MYINIYFAQKTDFDFRDITDLIQFYVYFQVCGACLTQKTMDQV